MDGVHYMLGIQCFKLSKVWSKLISILFGWIGLLCAVCSSLLLFSVLAFPVCSVWLISIASHFRAFADSRWAVKVNSAHISIQDFWCRQQINNKHIKTVKWVYKVVGTYGIKTKVGCLWDECEISPVADLDSRLNICWCSELNKNYFSLLY